MIGVITIFFIYLMTWTSKHQDETDGEEHDDYIVVKNNCMTERIGRLDKVINYPKNKEIMHKEVESNVG